MQDFTGLPTASPEDTYESDKYDDHNDYHLGQHYHNSDHDGTQYDPEIRDNAYIETQHNGAPIILSDGNVLETTNHTSPLSASVGNSPCARVHCEIAHGFDDTVQAMSDQPPLEEAGCTISRQQTAPQNEEENFTAHPPPAQHSPRPTIMASMDNDQQASMVSLKLPWKKPALDTRVYQFFSGRGFSHSTMPSRLRGKVQPRLWAGLSSPEKQKRPSAEGPAVHKAALHSSQAGFLGEARPAEWEEDVRKGLAKLCEQEQATLAQHNAEKDILTSQLQHTSHANRELWDQAELLRHENQNLSESLQQQQKRFASLGSKAKNFKTFLHGLGTDIDTLKQASGVWRQRSEELAQELDETKSTQTTLLEQSAKLKAEALKVAREAHGQLAVMTVHATQLKEQLNEKSQMLVEEKNARLHLQGQLIHNSQQDVGHLLKEHIDAILDKLSKIHADIEENGANDMAEMLKSLSTATQELKSKQSTTVEAIVSIKDIVASVSESLQARTSVAESRESSMKSHLIETLKALGTDLCRHEELIVQATVDRESIAHLTQALQDSSKEVADRNSALEKCRASYDELKERHDLLLGQTDMVAQTVAKHDADMERMTTIKADVQIKTKALESMSADLATKTDEVKTLTDANNGLRAEVESLQHAVNSAQEAAGQDRFAEKLAAATTAAKEEMSRIANDLHIQEKIESENKLRKIVSARNELLEQVTHLQAELASAKHEAEVSIDRNQSKVKLQKLADDRQLEIQSLQARIDDLTRSVGLIRNAEEKYDSLSDQYTTQAKQLDDGLRHKDQLAQQLETAKSQLADCREKVQAAELRIDRCKSDAQRQLANEQEKNRKRVDALQQHIDTTQAEKQKLLNESKDFQLRQQNSLQEHQKQQEEIVRLTNKATKSEAEKGHAVAECQRLESELEKATTLLARQLEPIPRSQNHQEHSPLARVSLNSVHGNLQVSQALQQQDPAVLVQATQIQVSQDAFGDALPTDGASVPGSQREASILETGTSQYAPYTYGRRRGSNAWLGSSQSHAALGNEDTQDLIDRMTNPGTKVSTRSAVTTPTFEQFNMHREFAIYEDDPAVGDGRVPTRDSVGVRSSNGDDSEFKKQMPPPNSSMKRVQLRDVSRRQQKAGHRPNLPLQHSPQHTTPEPRAATPATPEGRNSVVMQSSSPDIVVNSSQNTTLEQGMNKHNGGINVKAQGATAQAKRKADSQVVQGYESQRKKLVGEAPARGRSGLRSLSQPTIRILEERGLQSEVDASNARVRTLADQVARSSRDGRKLTKGERMSARFARELNG